MAERKSVNKYYPPDWDPSKGSINTYVGQHPLRDRAKKLGQGILVIRFEMPYNIWCGGCNSHIGMGVRYNAEKTKTGKYYTTPIYKFRMKCHLCDNYFEIQTDPKNHDYVILEGARRKEQRWDPKENEQIVPEDKATQKKMATDAMFKLEHGSDDVQRGQKAKANLGSLESSREEWKDDFILNKIARQKFREEKKVLKKAEAADDALLTKSSLDLHLVKETEDDIKLAGLMKYRAVETYDEKQAQKRQAIEDSPLFSDSKKPRSDKDDSSGGHKLDIIRKCVRMSKTGRNSGPFDRMTMNNNKCMSTLTQTSLGIRRKSKDVVKQTADTGTNSYVMNQHNDNQHMTETVLDSNKEELEVATPFNERLTVPTNCEETETVDGKPISNIPGDDVCKMNVNDERNRENINETESNTEASSKCSTLDCEKTIEKDTNSKLKASSGLSLVSSYSDSDTDSNSDG